VGSESRRLGLYVPWETRSRSKEVIYRNVRKMALNKLGTKLGLLKKFREHSGFAVAHYITKFDGSFLRESVREVKIENCFV
jgi:hypothetical protein